MSQHDLPVGGVDVGRRVVVVDVPAVVVRERVLESPRRPVLDVDQAPHAELLHQRGVVAEVVQTGRVQGGSVVHKGAVGQPAKRKQDPIIV